MIFSHFAAWGGPAAWHGADDPVRGADDPVRGDGRNQLTQTGRGGSGPVLRKNLVSPP